jgi:flavocytochrome c
VRSGHTACVHSGHFDKLEEMSEMAIAGAAAAYDIVVVGAGLAGMVAAIAASDASAAAGILISILLIDKQPSTGGNSAKASSGMNAAVTPVQLEKGIQDSVKCFYDDTFASGDGLSIPDLVQVLTDESESAWEFLKGYGVELTKLSRCGGHKFERTHRQDDSAQKKPTNVGFFITSSLAAKIAERPNIKLITDAKVTELLKNDGNVSGVKYIVKGSDTETEVSSKSVILATGGYGGDFSETSYLKQYNELAWTLASTNGAFASGDGVTLGKKAGAGTIHMDKVQIHPTSFVDPKNPYDKTKFLAPEALRGHGGILMNQKGLRFVNELGRRDVVTKSIFDHCDKEFDEEKKNSQHIAFLILNEKSKTEFGPGFGFYSFKGFFKKYSNFAEFANENGISTERTENDLCERAETSLPCFAPVLADEVIYVAKITPAVHYTMGGLKMSRDTEILTENDQVISGLFGAGEVTGGVHGENRLAGNSLLECIVFGRRAGSNAFKFLTSKL